MRQEELAQEPVGEGSFDRRWWADQYDQPSLPRLDCVLLVVSAVHWRTPRQDVHRGRDAVRLRPDDIGDSRCVGDSHGS